MYNPNWEPKMTIKIAVETFPTDKCYLMSHIPESVGCTNSTCSYITTRRDKIQRHIESCQTSTVITTTQIQYGSKKQLNLDLDIPITIFTEPEFHFCVFDIETLESKTDLDSGSEAHLKLLSIKVGNFCTVIIFKKFFPT